MKRNYILVPKIDAQSMYVMLKDEASIDDTLCSYFHAVLLAILTCAINAESLVSRSNYSYSDSSNYYYIYVLIIKENGQKSIN